MSGDERSAIPYHLRGIPLDNNDLIKTHINEISVTAGFNTLPFPNVNDLPPDNGEKFFSKYLVEQLKRNEMKLTHKSGYCLCDQCVSAREINLEENTLNMTQPKKQWNNRFGCSQII